MGSFVVYILEWTLCLSAFLLLYKMCFSGSTFHRFNRYFLLGSVVLSALLPLIHITTSEQMEPIAYNAQFAMQNAQLAIDNAQFTMQDVTTASQVSLSQRLFIVLAFTYFLYIAIQAVGWLRSLVKMMLFLRGKRSRRVGRWIRLVVHNEEYGPFSWMNYIVISDKENGFGRRASMHHELSHIRLLHPLDLVFILLCTLVNPVCWLIMKEIKVVHEYEADDEVINHYHIRSREYQRLLIQRTVGAEAYALACSFNLNIKKRIIMMKKKQSTWWRMTWIAVTLPLVGLALTAFSKPKEALKEVVNSSLEIVQSAQFTMHNPEAVESEAKDVPAPASVKEVEAVEAVKPGDKITGTVKDANGPLAGVNLVEIDESGRIVANAVSDNNGNFALKVKDPKNKIRISYVGMRTQTLDIVGSKIDVTMEEAMKFHQVVVTGRHDSIDNYESRYRDYDLTNKEDQTFNVVESIPTFPGGFDEIMKYLSTHLRYPAVAREMPVEAEITVQFVVDKTGLVRSPKVVNVSSQSPVVKRKMTTADGTIVDESEAEAQRNYNDAVEALKEEAVYVIRSMPRWNPGRQNGKRVETTYTLPVSFKLYK